MTGLMLVGGLALLVLGAELLVNGASRLAGLMGVSPLVVGLTVVAFGTSSPELAVSLQAASNQQGGIALGNAVGSNIFNVLFILGLSAMIVPLRVAQQLIRLDVPLMIVASVLVLIFALDGRLGRFEGLILFNGLVLYIVFLVHQSRQESKRVKEEYAAEYGMPERPEKKQLPRQLTGAALKVAVGLVLLVLGARWLVSGAVAIAQALAVSEVVIGLTIIAIGTSLPEVVTSLVASVKGERDIAVGNVIGSNIFNLLGVLGLTSMLASHGIPVQPETLSFDLPVMTMVAFACLPVFFTGHLIARWEGVLFFSYYLAYVAYLVLASSWHPALEQYRWAMLVFVLPMTVLTLGIGVVRHWLRPSDAN